MRSRHVLIISVAAVGWVPTIAGAEPGSGVVEVRNEVGTVVAQHSGADAVAVALASVRSLRVNDGLPWSVVAGGGTYGDVLVDEPNLTVRSADGAAVVIAGTGGTDQTAGNCVDVTRGAVVLQTLACTAPAGHGIEVRTISQERGVVVRRVTVTRSGQAGVAIAAAVGVTVEDSSITGAGGDGLVVGAGSHGAAVTGTSIASSTGVGLRVGLANNVRLSQLRFNGANVGGDVRFSAETRSGGRYETLRFIDTAVTLAGEPRGVIVSGATAAHRRVLSARPPRTVTLGRYVRVRDTGTGTSRVDLRFLLSEADLLKGLRSGIRVFEDDPPGNARRWQAVPGSGIDAAGTAHAVLSDARIASGSDARFATYAPLAPRNDPPKLSGVFPANGGTYVGRRVVVSALAADDGPLGTGSFRLEIDGKVRGGIEMRGATAVWPLLRLGVGTHVARVLVVDAGGRRAERSWSFTVVNKTPRVVRFLSTPRPRALVGSGGRVRISVLIDDDERLIRDRARLRVDGRTIDARVRGRRLVAMVRLRPGVHRLQVIYTDLDGAQGRRGWTFRVRR